MYALDSVIWSHASLKCPFVLRRYAGRDGCVCARGDDRCAVDVAKRNDCMSCRIKKCYTVGMKKVSAVVRCCPRKRERERETFG